MKENRGSKLSGIRQIVKLKEMLQKRQSVTLASRANVINGDSSSSNNNNWEEEVGQPQSSLDQDQIRGAFCQLFVRYCDSDEDGCQSSEPPLGIPKGYLAVYVGPELQFQRLIIPTTHLTHPLFKVLLEKVEEEFVFDHCGGLTIPCEVETFKYLLKCMERPIRIITTTLNFIMPLSFRTR